MDDPPLLPDLLTSLLEVPDNQIDDPDESEILDYEYKEWGFNIHRTACGGSDSDMAWEALVEDVRKHVRLQIQGRYTNENEEEVEAAKKLMSLFRLSVHSDPETLQGADLDQLRQVHTENVRTGKALSNACWALRQMILVADGEVLTDVATGDFWIKCVEADYVASRHVGRDRSRVLQQYFGWFKMRSNRFIELWLDLQFHHLKSISPPTIGGMHLEIWHGDDRL
ncbi:hypothetical protein COL154_005970 [Colletotrichum chrysophilum]|uniref:Uncharacterized protein n=1 Tax=Colletotrichum chrysophilum TaxID=1836956 RepID=A0AAD9AKH4_9PEZI|nr:uncharacterized protein COL26b_012032 [Colletotrichum chrysophilum]KAJ0341903.1 hypothetical protein KNSL1_010901 [Colletotrichum chrysophilum]KAJ0362789.1 hypothetical protein COL154_005970 [Colletotrichum chrysophilum]KAJ0365459.1 hypothetical protein COL26b_012032 [Colletotrichum chrysophilum]KAK1848362.1 hypothetical protein CCHR01_08980 [Colletotrichum chrysophilum]